MKGKNSKEKLSTQELNSFTNSFASFNKITQSLQSAYRSLEEKFENLNQKLEQANRELRQSLAEKDRISNYLNNILESLTSGVLAINLDGKITLFNRAAEEMLGYKSDEVLGKLYPEIIGKNIKEECAATYLLKSKGSVVNQEKEIYARDGRKIPVGYSITLLSDSEGELIGAVEIFFDLTKLRQLEEEVSRVKTLAALGEMAATVAHEVRNPLGGIAGFAALLDRDIPEEDERKRLVKKIIQGVEILNRTVSNLLNYTRVVKLNPTEVDLVKFADEVVAYFNMDISQKMKNITIQRNYPDRRLVCRLDTEQFRQVVLNLLYNAAQSMPNGGKITFTVNDAKSEDGVEAIEGKIVLEISDCGVGMNKETQAKLFTPFFTTREEGTGLGLSTVKKIVEAHRGDIYIQSEPGKGTKVRVILPKGITLV
ncbi:MAG: ATP-binding protein [candidate division Zixibacteria bacterium]|nr:ATP-binding protein [candidate division Zixibacteria bacterium]